MSENYVLHQAAQYPRGKVIKGSWGWGGIIQMIKEITSELEPKEMTWLCNGW